MMGTGMNHFQVYLIMFLTGGFLYCGIEILYRGYSHISMLFAGGLCFVLVGAVENILGDGASLIGQMIICGLMITGVEFIVGMIVNRQMHLNVWDYSGQQYNFKGQVCLLYTNLWILLSCPVITWNIFFWEVSCLIIKYGNKLFMHKKRMQK